VDRGHLAGNEVHITVDHLMDSYAAYRSIPRGRLIHAIQAKRIDGDLIRWTERFLSDRTVEMVIEGNVLLSHPVEAGVAQCSPVSPIFFAIHTAWEMK
jgi:hypothetical protein